MTPPSEFWAMVYLVKLHRGERCDDCKAVADKATQDYQEMLRKTGEANQRAADRAAT